MPVVLALLLGLLGVAIPAHADDMIGTVRWSGVYAGINAGYGFGNNTSAFTPGNLQTLTYFVTGGNTPVAAVPNSVGVNSGGPLFGVQLGYNWQLWSHVVMGLEADIDVSTINGSSTWLRGGGDPATATAEQKLSSFSTVRVRLGYAVDRVLFYVTGGLAYADTQFTTILAGQVAGPAVSSLACPGAPQLMCSSAATSQWMKGPVLGGGVEWAITPVWSVKGEYLHYDLGSRGQSQFDPTIRVQPVPVFNSSVSFHGDIVRVGLNFKLN
jgi:outer membrane immunogenic protein